MTEAAQLVAVVSGREVGVSDLLAKIETGLKRTDDRVKQTQSTFTGGLSRAQQKASGDALSLAQSYARLDAAMGRPAAGADRLRQALANAEFASLKQANAIQTQIARLDQLAKAQNDAASGTDAAASGFGRFAAAAGVASAAALAVQQAISIGSELAKESLALQKTEAAIRQLTGSQEAYARVVAIAREQQSLFGGTLNENLSDLSSLVVQSKASGASLESLIDISQRLATFDPGQGIRGASVAIRELMSGNPRSLAMRFELPAAALKQLSDASLSSSEKLQILSGILDQAGITSELVTGTVSETARAYNELGAAFDNARTKLGAFIAEQSKSAVQGAGALLDAASGNTVSDDQQQGLIESMRQLTGMQRQLTEGEKQFAAAILERIGIQSEGQAQQEQLATIQASYESGLLTLAAALDRGTITADQFNAATEQLTATKERAIAAAQGQTDAETELAGATNTVDEAVTAVAQKYADEIAKKQQSADEARILYGLQQDLANIAGPVAQGLVSAGGAAQILAQRYNIATDAAYALVQAQAAIAGGEQRIAAQARQTRDVSGSVGFNAPGRSRQTDADIFETINRTTEENARATREAAEEQRKLDEAIGGTSVTMRNLERDRNAATVGSAEWLRANRLIREEQEKQNKKAAGGRGGGSSATAKEQARELKQATKFADDRQELERDHQERMAEIVAEGEKRRQEIEQRAHQEALDSRAAFYDRLGQIEDPALQARMAEQFEAAVQKASEIARTKGPDAGQEYLDAATKAIERDSKLEAQIAEAEKKGEAGRAEYLRGIQKLYADAEAERLRTIAEGEDAIAAVQAQKLAEEEARYQEQLAELNRKRQEAGLAPVDATGLGAPPTTTASGALVETDPNAVKPVVDEAAAVAVDSSAQQIVAAIESLGALISSAIEAQTSSLSNALRNIKVSTTFTNN